MDEEFYSQILQFYTSPDRKYPEYIYDVPMDKRVDQKSKFRQQVKPYHVEDGVVKLDVGTQVYIKNARRIHRMGSKMEPRWTGP